MVDTPAEPQDFNDQTDGASGHALASMVAGAPLRPDLPAGPVPGVASAIEALGDEELAALGDPALLRAGVILLGAEQPELAARCFTALEGRETSAAAARLGMAWVEWARGDANACVEGLRAAAELDPSLRGWPEGTEPTGVRARAGALVVLVAKGDDGEHDVERVSLGRPLLASERATLSAAAEHLTGLEPSAAAGYRGLVLEDEQAMLTRAPLDGEPLAAALGDEPRALPDALAIVAPLAEALAAAHERGVCHGGVRAELVTQTADGPVLRGFGLAGLVPPTCADAAAGVVAPERLAGGPASAQTDAYGLGALLYRLLTGRDPAGAVLRPSTLQLDSRLDALVEHALHPDPRERLDVATLLRQARDVAETAGAPAVVATGLSLPITLPEDPDDLEAWVAVLERKPTHREARDAIVRIEAEARTAERWDRVAEALTVRARLAEVQQRRVELRRELMAIYAEKLDSPASAFREAQGLVEEISVEEQVAMVAELHRMAEVTGQWAPLAESLEIVANRAPQPADQARLFAALGRVHAERLGAADPALAAYGKAIAIEPDAATLAAAATLYRKEGQLAELVGTLLNLAEHHEGEARAQTLREAAAVLHDELGDEEGALATLRAALEAHPGHAETLATAETYARALEDWEGLYDLLDRRASAATDEAAALALRTEAATLATERLNDPERALAQLDRILAQQPDHEPSARARVERLRPLAGDDPAKRAALIEALRGLVPLERHVEAKLDLRVELAGLLDHQPEGEAEAARVREKLVEVHGFQHEAVREAARALGEWYEREGQPGRHVELLRRVGSSMDAPTPARVQAWRSALERLREGPAADDDGALVALEALTALEPEDQALRDALLEAYLAREDFEKAGPLIRAQVYDEGIDPKRKAALLWQGGKLRDRLGKAEGAVEALEEAVQLDPSLHDAWLALRDLYRQREQPLKAMEAQVAAAQAHPSRSEKVTLLFDAATAYLGPLGQPDKGVALLEQLVDDDPDHREATGMLVEHLVAEGDLTRAWPVAKIWVPQVRSQARDDTHANLRALSIAGRCALAVDEPERAREYLEKARGVDASDLDVLRLLGEMDMEAERWEDALRSYQAVVLGAADSLPPPEQAQVYLRMARARLGLKERPKALQLIERALDIHPESQPAIEMLVELAETPAALVEAKLRQAAVMARREAKLAGDEQAEKQAERIALLQEIAKIQTTQLDAPEDAARTLEVVLAMEPEDPAVLHGLMDVFTKAQRWRDVTRVIERLAAQQPTDEMRAKYLYAGAAIQRDQLDDAEAYTQWIERVLEADPTHAKAQRGLADLLEKKGAWKELGKHLRGRLKSLPKEASAEERVGLFTQLGEVYEQHLGDPKTALAAYTQAVRFTADEGPGLRARRVKIMELALSLGDDELDKAILQGHALIAADPMEFETYHRMVDMYQRRGNDDRATAIARTLSFLKQANPAEQALVEAAAEREAQIRSVVTRELWRKTLYHAQQDPRLTEIFAIVWPIVAAREGHTHAHHSVARADRAKLSLKSSDALARYLSYAAGVYDVPAPDYFPRPKEPGGLRVDALCEGEGDAKRVFPTVIAGRDTLRDDSEAGLKFRAAAAMSRVRPGHILASVLPSAASLRHVFFGASALAGVELPPDSATEAERLSKHLKRFMTPAQIDQLGALSRKVLDRGEPDVKGWAQGVAYTSSRAGFVLCDSIDSAARVLTQQGDEGMVVPFKDRIRDLVAYSCSTSYLKLRKELGLTR